MALTKAQEFTVDILKKRGFSQEEIFVVLCTLRDYKELNSMIVWMLKEDASKDAVLQKIMDILANRK